MLSGVGKPMGSFELVYWRAYLVIKDERERERMEQFGGLF